VGINHRKACLTGIAAFVLFVIHPGGFETGIGWFLVLLPGTFAGYGLSDHLHRIAPHVEPIVFWTPIVGISFLWYWGISYGMIKLVRAVVHVLKR
jgi:hypothetical protein